METKRIISHLCLFLRDTFTRAGHKVYITRDGYNDITGLIIKKKLQIEEIHVDARSKVKLVVSLSPCKHPDEHRNTYVHEVYDEIPLADPNMIDRIKKVLAVEP